MATPPDLQLDWFAQALDSLEAFLLSDDVFRPLPGLSITPRQDLSLGGLLLAADWLGAHRNPLSMEQRAHAAKLLARWETETSGHRAAIIRKAVAEARQRSNLWRAYVADLLESPRETASYRTEVRHRVALERLLGILEGEIEVAVLRAGVQEADRALRQLLAAGEFIWEDFLEVVYPQRAFWFLYGRLIASGA